MNKRTGTLLTGLIVLSLATLACGLTINLPNPVQGNGDVTEETRDVESFDRIEINGLGDINVELGAEETLLVEAEENLLPHLETYVRGSTLVIEIEDERNIIPTKPVKFYLTVVSLEGVAVSGLGNITLPEIEAERFTIDISGAGDIEIDSLNAESFDASMSGLGNLSVFDGQVVSQEVTISGSSGLGSATVRVSDYLKVTISGGGDVNYYGNPEIDSEISGVGDLDRLGD